MNHRDINWAQAFRELKDRPDKAKAGSEEARALWNEKAPSFARKPSRSDYINQLIGLLELERSDSVLDVGCGSGTLAIPLAALGHAVVALDFSPVMLSELEQSASEENIVAKRIHPGDAADGPVCLPAGGSIATLERSWQQSWADIPIADIAVSSRSLITEDLADSVRKLEEHARKRAFITVGAGSLPYRDHAILSAMGRSDEVAMDPTELICLVNYLFSLGRLPRISYISFTRFWGRDTREMLVDAVKSSHAPRTPHEEKALERYLAEHVICNEESGQYELDRPRVDRWACVSWDVPNRCATRIC